MADKSSEEPVFDLKKLTPEGIVFAFYFFISIVSPGFLYFYLFHRDFFLSTDWIKLLFLSGGITIPLLIINTFTYSLLLAASKDRMQSEFPKYFKQAFPVGAWLTMGIFYCTMTINYIAKDFKSGWFLFSLGLGELIVILWRTIEILKVNRRNKNEKTFKNIK